MVARVLGVAVVAASAVVVAAFGAVLWIVSTAWDMAADEELDEAEAEPEEVVEDDSADEE
jgi:hypothetical protein